MRDDDTPGGLPRGRLARLGRLAALGPRAAAAAVRAAVTSDEEALGRAFEDTLSGLRAGSMKLGQTFAQVADDLPAAARARLGRLYSEVAPLPVDGARERVEALGGPLATFEPTPFAAASLGQVFAATLPDGTPVAVKLRYADADAALRADLDLLAHTGDAVTGGGLLFDARTYFTTLREDTLRELDYRSEARHRDQLADAVRAWPDLVVPQVYPAWSGEDVLTMERVTGPTLHAWLGASPPADRAAVADRLIRAVLGPPLAGLINADAHPGNFVVRPDALVLLDFGAVRSFAHATGLRALLRGLVSGAPLGADALDAVGFDVKVEPTRRARFSAAVLDVLRPVFARPYDFEAGSVTAAIGAIKQRYPRDLRHVRVTPDAIALFRALLGLHHALRRLRAPVDVRASVVRLLG